LSDADIFDNLTVTTRPRPVEKFHLFGPAVLFDSGSRSGNKTGAYGHCWPPAPSVTAVDQYLADPSTAIVSHFTFDRARPTRLITPRSRNSCTPTRTSRARR